MNLNDFLWGLSNLLVAYFCVVLLAFTIFYVGFFKWWIRPAGVSVALDRTAFVLVLSLVFIGIFVDPQRGWWEAPDDVLWWRPWYRVLVYSAVAASTTFQFVVAFRRWLSTNPIQIEVDPRTRPPRKR